MVARSRSAGIGDLTHETGGIADRHDAGLRFLSWFPQQAGVFLLDEAGIMRLADGLDRALPIP